MRKKSNYLTGSEEELMELFWGSKDPLTSVEILKVATNPSWNNGYLHNLLRSLLKKEMIEVCGTVQYGSQYARQFVPSMTKEEYAAKIIMRKGLDNRSVAKVAVAMAKEANGDEEDLIEELEKIIEELKEENKEK